MIYNTLSLKSTTTICIIFILKWVIEDLMCNKCNFAKFEFYKSTIYQIIKSIKLKVLPTVSLIPNIIYDYIKQPLLTGYGDFLPIDFDDLSEIPENKFIDIADLDFNYLSLENDNNPAPFFCYTPELLRQLIIELELTLTNIAKSKLYGLPPRKKIINNIYDTNTSHLIKQYFDEKSKNGYYKKFFSKKEFLDKLESK